MARCTIKIAAATRNDTSTVARTWWTRVFSFGATRRRPSLISEPPYQPTATSPVQYENAPHSGSVLVAPNGLVKDRKAPMANTVTTPRQCDGLVGSFISVPARLAPRPHVRPAHRRFRAAFQREEYFVSLTPRAFNRIARDPP